MTRAQPLNVADKLDEARALIERGWCQGEYAFDALGRPMWSYKDAKEPPFAPVRFCSAGALKHINAGAMVNRALARTIGTPSVSMWNDAPERTQTEVIEAFKRAADLARAEA